MYNFEIRSIIIVVLMLKQITILQCYVAKRMLVRTVPLTSIQLAVQEFWKFGTTDAIFTKETWLSIVVALVLVAEAGIRVKGMYILFPHQMRSSEVTNFILLVHDRRAFIKCCDACRARFLRYVWSSESLFQAWSDCTRVNPTAWVKVRGKPRCSDLWRETATRQPILVILQVWI